MSFPLPIPYKSEFEAFEAFFGAWFEAYPSVDCIYLIQLNSSIDIRRYDMNKIARNLYLSAATMEASKVRLIVFVLSLAMFALAAGAPEAGGDVIR